jgi:hypothetical protein
MGWPLVAFLPFPQNHLDLYPSARPPLSSFMMAHMGAGYAEPYTDFPTVVCTPNCIRPDLATGFKLQIASMRPGDSLRMVHAEQVADWEAMAKGACRCALCAVVLGSGVCGGIRCVSCVLLQCCYVG